MSHLIQQVLIYYVTFLVALVRLTFTIPYLGNVYIADWSNNRIRKVTVSTGIITTIAGSSTSGSYSGDNGAATSAGMYYPYGVALDSAGNYSL
jgi:DNA-binding beta-propeller fold protein YncE